jgi:hypothetical protein
VEYVALAIGAVLALWIGARGLLAPELLAGRLSLVPDGPSGLNEARAQYGGFFAAVGLLAATALWRRALALPALWVLAVAFGGVLSGRLVGLVADGGAFGAYSATIQALFVVDAAGLALAIAALRRAAGVRT